MKELSQHVHLKVRMDCLTKAHGSMVSVDNAMVSFDFPAQNGIFAIMKLSFQ